MQAPVTGTRERETLKQQINNMQNSHAGSCDGTAWLFFCSLIQRAVLVVLFIRAHKTEIFCSDQMAGPCLRR